MDYRSFVEEQIGEIRKEVGEGTAINALSGGVDSSVVTALGFALSARGSKRFLSTAPSCARGSRTGWLRPSPE